MSHSTAITSYLGYLITLLVFMEPFNSSVTAHLRSRKRSSNVIKPWADITKANNSLEFLKT